MSATPPERKRGWRSRAQRLAYLQRKAADRRARIPAMRAAGIPVHLIAAALGAHPHTITRDIAALKREGKLP